MSSLINLFKGCVGGGGSETPQFLILGLDKAGKTTLLYRLKIGTAWPEREMQEDMLNLRSPAPKKGSNDTNLLKSRDTGYHYEELGGPFSYGAFEVAGTMAMRQMWKIFYTSIKIHGVIFVVDGTDDDFQRITSAKKNLHFLMNEDELRQAVFIVIINQRIGPDNMGIYDDKKNELYYRLGLHDLHPSCNWRTTYAIINILKISGENDKDWLKVMEVARSVLQDQKGFGLKNF